MRTLAWRAWELLPESVRGLFRPALAVFRRRRRLHTPLPEGTPPGLPPEAVELDTAIGTLWFDGADDQLIRWIRSQGVWEADVMKLLARTLRPATRLPSQLGCTAT